MNTTLLFLIIFEILSQKYRVILPPAPPQPSALNNTVQAQIANQNINFNTGSSISGGGGFGGFGQFGGGGGQFGGGGFGGKGGFGNGANGL